jgi:hypothetical protein
VCAVPSYLFRINFNIFFQPFLFLPTSPFPSRPHEGLVSPIVTSSTIGTTSTGRTDGHHSNTHRRTVPATAAAHLASTQRTVPLMRLARTARSRPTLTEYDRTTSRSNDHIRERKYMTRPFGSRGCGGSFKLQPSYPEQWVTDRKTLNLVLLGG